MFVGFLITDNLVSATKNLKVELRWTLNFNFLVCFLRFSFFSAACFVFLHMQTDLFSYYILGFNEQTALLPNY